METIPIMIIITIFILLFMLSAIFAPERELRNDLTNIEEEQIGEEKRIEMTITQDLETKADIFYIKNKEEIDALADKYYFSVKNLISRLESSNIFFNPRHYGSAYHNIFNTNALTALLIKKDGEDTTQVLSSYSSYLEDIKQMSLYVQELRKRLANDTECKEIDALIWYIVRNNFIRYNYESYLSNIGCGTLEELIEMYLLADNVNSNKVKVNQFILSYTYYCLYKNNISSSILSSFNEDLKILQMIVEQKKNEIDSLQAKSYFEQSEPLLFDSNEFETTIEEKSSERFTSVIQQIDGMDGRTFEIFIKEFFEQRGYKTTLTKSTGDYGIDIIIENDFLKIGIQTKCYTQKVGNSAVQEAVTGLNHYKLDKAMVITNNYFTASAIELAKDNNVILWDRNKLIDELEK